MRAEGAMRNDNRFIAFLRRNGLALLLTAGLFLLMYAVVLRFPSGENDYIDHMLWALGMSPSDIVASFYNGSARLWHICVRFLFLHVTNNLWTSAAIVTAAANAAAYFLVFRMFEEALPGRTPPRWLLALLMAAPFIVSALALPGGTLYANAGAVNTWHNPTNIMVRPFAAAVFYMTVRIYNRYRYGSSGILAEEGTELDPAFRESFFRRFRYPVFTWAELILYPLCLLFSVYAKPSFLQCFAPAICVFLVIELIRTRGRLFPFCVKLALPYIPVAFILLAQLFTLFPGGVSVSGGGSAGTAEAAAAATDSGIAVYFMQSSFAGLGDFLTALLSRLRFLLLPGAFACFIVLLNARSKPWQPVTRLALLCVAAAFLEYLFLHETGSRAEHGNFIWALHLSLWLLWGVAAAQYGELLFRRSARGKLARYVGTPLLLWHLICGIVYLVVLYTTVDYLV